MEAQLSFIKQIFKVKSKEMYLEYLKQSNGHLKQLTIKTAKAMQKSIHQHNQTLLKNSIKNVYNTNYNQMIKL